MVHYESHLSWKRMRKAITDGTNSTAAKGYCALFQEEALLLAESLVQGSDQWRVHIDRFVITYLLL